jgi:hypothetical protein
MVVAEVVFVGSGQVNGCFQVPSLIPHLPFPLQVSSQSASTEQQAPTGPLPVPFPHQPGVHPAPPVGTGPNVVVVAPPTQVPVGHLPDLQSDATLQQLPALPFMLPDGHGKLELRHLPVEASQEITQSLLVWQQSPSSPSP